MFHPIDMTGKGHEDDEEYIGALKTIAYTLARVFVCKDCSSEINKREVYLYEYLLDVPDRYLKIEMFLRKHFTPIELNKDKVKSFRTAIYFENLCPICGEADEHAYAVVC